MPDPIRPPAFDDLLHAGSPSPVFDDPRYLVPDPSRVTPEELRAHADCVGEVPYHREMVLRAADRIEALEARNRALETYVACIEAWPDAQNGEYNPACCRFPKSCSVYRPEALDV